MADVVTAKTQYSLSNAQSYFAEHLAVGDYYQEGQKVAGEWFGVGAQSLGLKGVIREADFLALCENQKPQSGDTLTQRTNTVREEDGKTTANRRIFYDFTFSPPKSVSVMALLAMTNASLPPINEPFKSRSKNLRRSRPLVFVRTRPMMHGSPAMWWRACSPMKSSARLIRTCTRIRGIGGRGARPSPDGRQSHHRSVPAPMNRAAWPRPAESATADP
jgi:hypothetical protein